MNFGSMDSIVIRRKIFVDCCATKKSNFDTRHILQYTGIPKFTQVNLCYLGIPAFT